MAQGEGGDVSLEKCCVAGRLLSAAAQKAGQYEEAALSYAEEVREGVNHRDLRGREREHSRNMRRTLKKIKPIKIPKLRQW